MRRMGSIKNRLKIAYNNIAFFANNIWASGMDTYQKTNQELHIRECNLKDMSDELTYPRNVRDNIPNSKSAQFSNYECSASRELCYASSSDNIAVHYPNICKQDAFAKPWMIPEVEKMFIHTAYSTEYDTIDIVKKDGTEIQKRYNQNNFKSCCQKSDVHVIYPVLLQSFEKTPGKPIYKCCQSSATDEKIKYLSSKYPVRTFEEMILETKIRSETVKKLWSEKLPTDIFTIGKKKKNVLKTSQNHFIKNSLQNYYEKSPTTESCHLKNYDYEELNNLADSIKFLECEFLIENKREGFFPLINKQNYDYTTTTSSEELPCTRRLYSAVLQGLNNTGLQSNTSGIDSFQDISNIPSSQITAATSNHFNLSSQNNSPVLLKSTPIVSVNQFPSQSTSWFSSSYTSSHSFTSSCAHQQNSLNENIPYIKNSAQTNILNKSNNLLNALNNTCVINVASVCDGASSCSQENNSNFLNNINAKEESNFITNSVGNSYGTNTLNSNYHFQSNSNYHNYVNKSFNGNFFLNNWYQSYSLSVHNNRQIYSPYNRQSYSASQIYPSSPQSTWFVQNNRTPTIFSVSHFTPPPYLYVPFSTSAQQYLRPSSRWITPTNYIRAPAFPSFHVSAPLQNSSTTSSQHWGVSQQSLCRSHSNNQLANIFHSYCENLSGSSNKNKIKIKTYNSQFTSTTQKRSTFQTNNDKTFNDQISSSIDFYFNKQNLSKKSSYATDALYPFVLQEKCNQTKNMESTNSLERQQHMDNGITFNLKKSSILFQVDNLEYYESDQNESETFLPVISSLSDELERQAIEQYEPSNDNFYRELEQEAKEQYNKDHSENSKSPPYKNIHFGGLTNVAVLIQFTL